MSMIAGTARSMGITVSKPKAVNQDTFWLNAKRFHYPGGEVRAWMNGRTLKK